MIFGFNQRQLAGSVIIKMCKWGVSVEMPVQVDVNYPNLPEKYELKNRMIDACLAPHIFKLNNVGCITRNCCCGHRQNWKYNTQQIYERDVKGGILIDDNCVRLADSIGYYVTVDEYKHSIIEIGERNE